MAKTPHASPHCPTPAVRPSGRTLFSIRRALSERSELVRHPPLASVPSNKAELGVNGFGSFCRNKRASSAGAKPGNTKNLVHPIVEQTHSTWFTYEHFLEKTQDGFPIKNVGNDRIGGTFLFVHGNL